MAHILAIFQPLLLPLADTYGKRLYNLSLSLGRGKSFYKTK
jgi:hypothetical protein